MVTATQPALGDHQAVISYMDELDGLASEKPDCQNFQAWYINLVLARDAMRNKDP